MFEVTADAWYVWVGVSIAAVAVFGVAAALPTAPPPDATEAAQLVDRVASSRYAVTGERSLDRSTAVRLTPRSVGLRGEAGRAHASFRYGPVTPVGDSEPLGRLLEGTRAGKLFDDPSELRRAARAARTAGANEPGWKPAPDTLCARHVTWRGVDVTLVG